MAKCKDHKGNEYSTAKAMCMEYELPVSVFYNRKAKGIMTLEEMLTTPIMRKRCEYIDPDTGEKYKSQIELSKKLGLSKSGIYTRLKNGISGKQLFEKKIERGHRFEENYKSFTDPFGITHKNTAQMCRYYDIDYNLYRKRIRNGMDMARAIRLGQKRRKRVPITDIFGITHKSKKAMLAYYGLTYGVYEYRRNAMGLSEKEALTMPKAHEYYPAKENKKDADVPANIEVMIPDEVEKNLISGYGGMYCILRSDTWEIFRYRKKSTHIPVFSNTYFEGKLYESEDSAVKAAKRILENEPALNLVVTYYGIACSAYYKTCIALTHKYY